MRRLLTFGGLALESDDGSSPRVRPQRLAILAVLAASDRGISRERMYGIFWPEADEEHARHSLRQALYSLRTELGDDVVQAEAVLVLDRARLGSDVGEFRAAVASSDLARAVQLASGPFLDGFFLAGAGGFERWVEDERAALAADAARALLALARDAGAGGDLDAAADWWQRLTRLDPLSGRFALGFLKALAARGDRAARWPLRAPTRTSSAGSWRRIPIRKSSGWKWNCARCRRCRWCRTPWAAPRPVASADATPWPGPPNELPAAGLPAPQPRAGVQPAARWTRRWLVGAAAAITVIIAVALLRADRWFPAAGRRASNTFAVGMIREEGIPDTLRIGGVLTDMLATNLARVAGLSVLSNVRLLELMRPGQDTLAVGYVDAARRAGAAEIFQGRLLAGPEWSLAIEIQRVEVATGIVRGAYRVHANDRYALVDSATAAIAHDLRLKSPASSIAEATTASPIAYRLYEEGLRALYQYDFEAAIRLFSAALQEDSTFAMAAYYDAVIRPGGDSGETARRSRALRLASRLPERERLSITAELLDGNHDPAAFAVAETLSIRYPSQPQAHERLAMALFARGEFAGARDAIERAIAIDSATEPADRQACRLCERLPATCQHLPLVGLASGGRPDRAAVPAPAAVVALRLAHPGIVGCRGVVTRSRWRCTCGSFAWRIPSVCRRTISLGTTSSPSGMTRRNGACSRCSIHHSQAKQATVAG